MSFWEWNVFAVNGFWTYRPYDAAKRLTDAELAAEYWKASERARSCVHPALHVQRANAIAKLEVLHRFATHPHYDEETDDE